MKKCSQCNIIKPLEDFPKCKTTIDRKQAHCKECAKKYQAIYQNRMKAERVKHQEELNENPNYIESPEQRITLNPFTLKLGDKVKFLKSWETSRKVGYGTIVSITKDLYTVFTGKYKTSFIKTDFQRGCKNVMKVRG